MDSRQSELKRIMAHYCLNVMRKRSVDEQLCDFAMILDASLELNITYEKTKVIVCYEIGPHSASMKGLNESACVRQCKLDVLHKLRVFCNYTNDPAKTFHRRQRIAGDENNELSRMLDVYSEVELSKIELREETSEIASDKVQLIDRPEYDETEWNTVLSLTRPLTMKIKYFTSELKVTCKTGSHSASVTGLSESTCIRQARTEMLNGIRLNDKMVVEFIRDTSPPRQSTDAGENISDESETVGKSAEMNDQPSICAITVDFPQNDATNADETHVGENESICDGVIVDTTEENRNIVSRPCTPEDTTPDVIPILAMSYREPINIPVGPSKPFVETVAAAMNELTDETLTPTSEVFLNVLVEANRANRMNLGRIMDFVLQKAIYEPVRCGLYTDLCCEANKKALADSRNGVRVDFPNVFKYELIKACSKVLRAAGVLPESRPCGSEAASDQNVQRYDPQNPNAFDVDERVQTLGTCRFIGEIFMLNSFKVFKFTLRTLVGFFKARDAHSLECLCVLMTIIGPKFERIDESTVEIPAKKLFTELKEIADEGFSAKSLPARTIDMIDQLLYVRNLWRFRQRQQWTAVCPNPINGEPSSTHGERSEEDRQQNV